jgi:hypothetical protein
MRSGKTTPQTRRAWEPPTITKLAIGVETRSVADDKSGAASVSSSRPAIGQPPPPVAPTTKLGFSVEWAFPLSARWES